MTCLNINNLGEVHTIDKPGLCKQVLILRRNIDCFDAFEPAIFFVGQRLIAKVCSTLCHNAVVDHYYITS